MTTPMNTVYYPSYTPLIHINNLMYCNQGVDTIRLTARTETITKFIEALGLQPLKSTKGTPIHHAVTALENIVDPTNRYNKEDYKVTCQVFKLAKRRELFNYMVVSTYTPPLLDLATHHKKSKGEFSMITFAGLHQPTTTIKSDTMKMISKFLKRKTFKLYSLDIAIDHQTDKEPINYSRKEPFKWALMPLSKHGVIIPPNGATTLYINEPNHPTISKVAYYDKFIKQTKHHGQSVNSEFEHWKRLEVTITFDVTQKHNKGFTHYMESLNFVDDLYEVDEVATKAGIKSYDNSYLNYQINSLLDNRTMNNHESKKQFNSVEALERFNNSEFRTFTLPTI